MINISIECAALLLSRSVLTMCAVHCGAMVHVLFLMFIENNLQKNCKEGNVSSFRHVIFI